MVKMDLLKDTTGGRDTLVKVLTLTITKDGMYQLFVLGRKADLSGMSLPDVLTTEDLGTLSEVLSKAMLCLGLSKQQYILYVQRRKGFIKRNGVISVYLDCTFQGGSVNTSYPQGSTVRSIKCSLIVNWSNKVCSNCSRYRKSLAVMSSRSTPSKVVHVRK